MQTLQQALSYIHGRPKRSKRNSLAVMRALLTELNHPEKNLPPLIHVTGTNGKGSVVAMTASILEAAGYRTGTFTSPFIEDFRERIQVDGQWISIDDLLSYTQRVAEAVQRVEQKQADYHPSEFEVVTAIMLTYFAEAHLDAAVIEVGIGGLYDSTNVLPTSRVGVITSIALDHQALLGDTLVEIAEQKFGILHDGMTLVTGTLPSEVQDRMRAKDYHSVPRKLNEFSSGLAGQYQVENTATAVAAVRAFDPDISDQTIAAGLAASRIPGRFEKIGPNILIDGAHNEAGIKALYQALKAYTKAPIHLILGTLQDKNLADFLPVLIADPQFSLTLTTFQAPSGRPVLTDDDLPSDEKLATTSNYQQFFQAKGDQLVVFAGSLYFIAEVRSQYANRKAPFTTLDS
ncbi:bifunctional folylpolyglutamate synthase/dihydrofolate synthase [Eupransor demetentiae]|uniref:tetrahydrofolate synthase n=1 Tax=Eupransor demetentiae TaxID=3109584 RepID=A0ABP0ETV3_9LACO|nr:Folylpolyglutamate synthase/Dihydropteroate synthase (FolC) [Lactobacillaceae bacterium LMG 33000]